MSTFNELAELLDLSRQEWREHAACRGKAGVMFPTQGDVMGMVRAKRLCASCPVQDECLAYATEHGEHFGVWGGTAARERRRIRGLAS